MQFKHIIIAVLFLSAFCLAKDDIIYSQGYFDSLIQSSKEAIEKIDNKKEDEKEDSIIPDFDLAQDTPVFKLRIENTEKFKYDEIRKQDTKIEIPLTDKFSFIYDTSKFKNKYNSDEYKISLGATIKFNKMFSLNSGMETNFQSLNQNPTAKKIYLNPNIKVNNKISIDFYNKLNTLDKSEDHDIGLKITPFKSRIMDFGLYSGITRAVSGEISQSMSFSTNFYF